MVLARFRTWTLVALAWSLAVIVWGAYVRATGSGAGCGDHWPVCHGELIPRAPSVQTLIEFTHRLTSGLALLSVIVSLAWARRVFPAGHEVRRWAGWGLFFMLTEAALGAVLVKAELVANNATASRAVAMSIHLINTFLLVAAMTLTAFHAHGGERRAQWRGRGLQPALGVVAQVLVAVVGVSGAIAALGDTLVQQSILNPFVELLISLRIFHPVIAIGATLAVMGTGSLAWSVPAARSWVLALATVLVLQIMAGLVNVILQAPVWLQLVHLLLADLVWVSLWVVTRLVLTEPGAEVAPPVGAHPRA